MNPSKLIAAIASCSCGRTHQQELPFYRVQAGILDQLSELLRGCGFSKNLHLVGDTNTISAVGPVAAALETGGFNVSITRFVDMREADIEAVKRIIAESEGSDGILAVGSGSINDISRYASFLTARPYAVLATAPSMDGFTSTVSPIIERGFKRSFAAVAPRGVFADPAVLAAAPARLRAAGFGDLLGKYIALADWEICQLLTGEYWCPSIAALVRDVLGSVTDLAAEIGQGSEAAITTLMDALVLSGFCMLLVGSSRPASGAEHHISHFLEMRYLLAGLAQDFHGIKVGLATIEIAPIYAALSGLEKPPPLATTPNVPTIRRVFGSLADEIIAENQPDPLADINAADLDRNWPAIRLCLAAIPQADTLTKWFLSAGGPDQMSSLGMPSEWIVEARHYGPLVRRRLSVLRLLGPD